jgi:hypothetical protein
MYQLVVEASEAMQWMKVTRQEKVEYFPAAVKETLAAANWTVIN